MWVIFILVIVGIVLFNFANDLNKDNYDLQHQNVHEKFATITGALNAFAFNGKGSVIPLDKRSYNLYEDGQNQIINFNYSTGHLTITWKYKYFQKEVVHNKQFNNVRNLSIFEQQNIAERMILEMNQVVQNHKNDVIGGAY